MLSELRCSVKVVLLALRPTPPLLSAALPLKLAGTEAARKVLPLAGVVTDAVAGAVLSKVKVTAVPVPVKVLPTLSVAFACTVYVASGCEDQVGSVALLAHVAAVLPVVALCVVAKLETPDCHVVPVQ